MSFLLAAGKAQAKQTPAVSGLQLQTSAYGKAIPILYGTTRIAPNLLWYGDFNAKLQSSSPAGGKGGVGGGGGGKGGGGSGQYIYSTSFEMGLCEGPINGVGNVYVDKNIKTLASLNMGQIGGTLGQAPWSYLIGEAAPLTETHSIPGSGPYSVSVNSASGFVSDAGVTANANITYHRTTASPAAGQYIVSLAGNSARYTFNAANAGALVTVSYSTISGAAKVNATVPASPYTLTISIPSESTFSDKGVVSTGVVFAQVATSPALNQYSVSGGLYTFNSGNHGSTVSITYYTAGSNPEALGYSGIAMVVAADYGLGNSPQLPNHNFEVAGLYSASLSSLGVPDADPSLVVADFLTNSIYGVGFPSARLGSLSTYQAYTIASGLWISPAYTDQASASTLLDDIATATNSAFVWSSGTLTLVPYGDQAITQNGYTYTPPSTPLYDLDDDDSLPNTNATAGNSTNNDPVIVTRKRQSDALNAIQVECLDRNNLYNPAVVEAKDQALITIFGLRQGSSKQLHLFADVTAGRLSAQLQLQRQAIRNIYQFTLDQRYVLLDPMDIVTITDPALGLNKQPVRITEITENDDRSLSFVAEEYLAGTGNAPAHSFQQGQGFNADYNLSSGDANTPVLFEPTAELAESLEVWVAASGDPSVWGGCDVWVSTDGNSYQLKGRINGAARAGVLSQALASVSTAATGQTVDAANALVVDLTQSDGQLVSGSLQDATSLNTLCYIDGEYIAYETANLVSDSVYSLSYLVRGVYGSPISAHMAGGQFARLDGSIFKIPFTPDYIGQTLYIKLLSFNIYGGGEQQLSDVQPYAYTLKGTAYSSQLPDIENLRTSYVANITQLAWDEIDDFRPVQYEIRQGAAWIGAQVLGRVAHPPFNVQGNGTYWVASYTQPTAGLQVYGQNPQSISVSGAQIISNVIASYDEAATGWTGSFGGAAALSGSTVITGGAGNILTDPDYLNTADIFYYGGAGNGTYTIPSGHVVNIGRVAPCSVIVSWTAVGQHFTDNILAIADYLNQPDILDSAAAANIDVYPEIALSQDGSTWGDWQKFTAGSYVAMAYKARMQLQTFDPTIEAILSAFVFEVDVPDRDDHYVNVPIATGGTVINFAPDGSSTPAPFNGGPQGSPLQPHIQVTILNAQSGDIAVISGVTLAQCTVQVVNASMGVARNVNILVEGY